MYSFFAIKFDIDVHYEEQALHVNGFLPVHKLPRKDNGVN